MDSILNSIKKMLGIEPDYPQFDQELILFINSVFGILYQLGVGDDLTAQFSITGPEETWDQFISLGQIQTVKSYMFMKVKLLFDPPTNSSVLSSYQELIKEFEWRCNFDSENLRLSDD